MACIYKNDGNKPILVKKELNNVNKDNWIVLLCVKLHNCLISTESPRQHSLMDRPPTRSGNSGSDIQDKGVEPVEKKVEPVQKQQPKQSMKLPTLLNKKDYCHWLNNI